MKMVFITAALSVMLLLVYCSKSNDFSASYLKGTMDGIAFECTANIQANKPEPIPGLGSDPTLRITGEWPLYSLKLILHNSGSSLSVGTYVFEGGQTRSATIVHNGVDSYYAGNGGLFNPVSLYGSGRITIQEINSMYVKGSFEFVTAVNSTTGNFKTVTNGEFYIKRS